MDCAIDSYYRLLGMLDSIVDNGLGITLALCKTYGLDYFGECYVTNNDIKEIREKLQKKYIEGNENNCKVRNFGNYLIKVCNYAKQVEDKLFNDKETYINPYTVENLVGVILEDIAKQTNRFSLCVGAGTLEKSLIYDFMDNIDYDI